MKTAATTATRGDTATATLRALFEAYAESLAHRSKGAETIACAVKTARVVERLCPEWLDRPVGEITPADLFGFRKARTERSVVALQYREEAAALRAAGKTAQAQRRDRLAEAAERAGPKPSTINRDLRTLRAMLKKARPDYRFPGAPFFQEDETRVRWLRPEEELLALEPMRAPFREMAKLAAPTLMRLGEIRLLRREGAPRAGRDPFPRRRPAPGR